MNQIFPTANRAGSATALAFFSISKSTKKSVLLLIAGIVLTLLAATRANAQTQFWSDTFEDAGAPSSGTRTPSLNQGGGGPPYTYYFIRTDGSNLALQQPFTAYDTFTSYQNVQGSKFWAGENTDQVKSGITDVNDKIQSITWTGIDITGKTGLSFKGLFAALQSEGWQNPTFGAAYDFLIVEYRIDGGTWSRVGGFNGDTYQTNAGRLREDTNGDNYGDGTLLSRTFQEFNWTISGTGSTLDLRFRASADASATQEFAIDNFRLYQTAAVSNSVSSINRAGTNPTNATSVNYTVTFASSTSSVDASDFTLTKTGTANGTIGTPTGSGTTWTVPVTGITGAGTLRLDFTSTTGVTPNTSTNYTSGQTYTIDNSNVEFFENATINAQTFTNGATGLEFTLTNKFFIQNYPNFGVDNHNPPTSTIGSNFYIDNFANQATNQVNTIKTTKKGLFAVKSFWAYPSSLTDGTQPTNNGTLTFTGKKNGVTQYTISKSGIFQSSVNIGSNYNGFALVDFSVGTDYSNTLIDELEVSLGSTYKYLALDNFTFTATPAISNTAATAVTSTTATLNALINPSNAATSAISFDYSTSPTLASGVTNVAASPASLAASSSATSVSANITGLTGGVTYYYRAKATNSIGTNDNSAILSFTTISSNQAPTNIALSASTIDDNVAANTLVGTLSTTDPDAANTFTYTLVSGTGDTDNSAFNISGNGLRISGSPNYNTKNSYTVRVRTTDQGGLSFEKQFNITVNPPACNVITQSDFTLGTDIAPFTKTMEGQSFTFTPYTSNYVQMENDIAGFSGLYAYKNVGNDDTEFTLSAPSGYSFDFNSFRYVSDKGAVSLTVTLTFADNTTNTKTYSLNGNSSINVFNSFTTAANDIKSIKFSTDKLVYYNNLCIDDVKLIPVTNVAPTNIALSASSINENVAANSTVGTLSSTDADAANTFTYTLVSGSGDTDNTAFNINGSDLRITASPDFETKSSYSVRVKTTDQGGLTYEKVFTITINNVNEAPTLSGGPYNFNVTTIGNNSQEVLVSDLLAGLIYNDQDAGALKGIIVVGVSEAGHWQFSNGSSSDWINATSRPVDANNGVLLSASDKIFYTPGTTVETASITFRAWDQTAFTASVPGNVKLANPSINGGTSSFSSGTASAIINVIAANTAPIDIAVSASAINENVAANSSVATLSTTDADAANTFTYTLVSGSGDTDNTAFNINGSDLRITASPDFETKSSYSVRVRTTDQGGLSFEKSFTITINNLNEAPTNIALSTSSINENIAAGPIGLLSSTDPDASNTFTYTLVSGTGDTDNALFAIFATSLRITTSPDFESKSSYSVRVRSTDQGGLSFEKVLTLTVNNVNEAPVDLALSTTSINENVAANSTVGTLSSFDPDASNTFTYTLVSGTGSTDNAAFNISGNNLRITASPDFETKNSYSIRIRTTDQGSLTFEKVFTITINNLNEAPIDIALSASSINENVAANSTVGTLSSTDVDASNTFTYTLVSGTGDTDNAAFTISGNSLKITNSPDFENQNGYSVRIRTTDQGGLSYEKSFAITINNVNEAPTDIFLNQTSIAENSAANTTVGTLSPGDPDPAGSHSYSLVSGTGDTDNAAFSISGTSLKFTGTADYETKNSYSIRIRITDQDNLTLEKQFTINITNVNEAPTNIALSASSINENVAAGSTIGALSTTDVDASNTFTYTLISGTGDTDNAAFSISGSNLNIVASPDFETKNSYSVRVKVADQGNLTFEKSFTITINNVNESPSNIALSASSINENVTANSTVGTLSSTDIDASNTFTYTLVAGTGDTDNTAFNISGNNLRITASPNFETKNSYSVRVRTTDQGGLSFEKTFAITINNLNEAPTNIALSASSINENVAANSTVGALSSTDADVSNTFTYALVSGTGDTDNAAFNISGNNLRITASPDFETKNSYSVRVRTTDQGELAFEKVFNITINNVNEVPSNIVLSASSISENVAANSTIGTLTSTDVDASNTFTYTLVSGTGDTDNAAFNISGNSLRITASPDYETKNSYSVRVRTTDQGGLTFEKAFTITITDVTELVFTTTSLANATIGANYQQQINVTVGASPYGFALTSGSLPAGITLSSTGNLSGTPTEGGNFNIELTATDQNNVSGAYTYTLNVGAPTLALTASLSNGTVNASYTQTIATTGGTAPYTYAVTAGALPPGLTLSAAGAITGTPTIGGTYNFTVKATDASTGTGPYNTTKAYALVIDPTVQTITLNASATATYGDADIDPAATSTNSGINITYSSSDPTIATIVSNKVHIVKAGTVTIYADQAANASYTAAVQKQQTLTINKKTLGFALTGTVSKTYDGNASATLTNTNFSLSGKVGADVVTVALPITASYANENVGTSKLVTVTGATLSGADQANYQLASTTANAAIGEIVAKPITLTLNASPAITKVYDRNTTATLVAGNYTLTGVEAGDAVTVSGTANYDSPTVNTGKTITVNTFVLAGADKDNYNLTTTTATTTGAITTKPITLALNAAPAITKVYNGNAIATLGAGNYTLTGVEVGDVVTVSGTASYNDKTVAVGKTITANTFVLAGTDKNNYNLTTTTASTTGSITAKPITLALNASPAISKVYDGNTSAVLVAGNYTLTGLVGSDEVSVTGAATYNNATVNTGKTVTANTFVLGGADKNNYNLTTTTATTTGAITAKPLTLALNPTPSITKVYDGSTLATLVAGNYTLTGVEAGDVVSVSGTANYNDKTATTGKTITVNTFVLAGADKNNYSLSTTSATTTGSITTKPITLALNATPVISKVYDGNTSAALVTGNYSLTGVVSGDDVVATGTANYDNPAAATGKTITVNTFVLDGADKNNYNLTTATATTTGIVTKAVLMITADNKTRVQNTPDPQFTASYLGFVNSETAAVLTAQPTFTTTATLSSLPGPYQIIPAGAAALNYNISYTNGTLTVTPGTPTSITLAQGTLLENKPAGTLAGNLSSTSDDPNATFTFELVGGTGDTDNSLFTIAGAQLLTSGSLNYEQKASYSIRVKSSTQYGLSLEKTLTIALTDVNEQPTLNVIGDQTLCANSDRQTTNLTGISAGPETSQSTSLTVTSNNASLFSELSVSNSGVLTYRTANGMSGVATVTVTVKDNGGTANNGVDSYSRSFKITVNALPIANITTEGGKITLSKGETLILKASGGATYNWISAAGIIGARNNSELTIRPEATTTYTVEVISASGCSVTKSITINVSEDYMVVKGTNLLSPNGDGKNDRFVIRNIDMYPNNEVKIYDRAGRLLFSKVNYTNEFDGTFQGSPLAEDTYYYIVDFGPGKLKLKGFITIVRD